MKKTIPFLLFLCFSVSPTLTCTTETMTQEEIEREDQEIKKELEFLREKNSWNNLLKRTSKVILSNTKKAGNYLLSKQGIKDICLAYVVSMGLLTMHELGHAITAKMFSGAPINITIGKGPESVTENLAQLGGIAIGGFNPLNGAYAKISKDISHPLQAASVCLAGPIVGFLSSLLLRKFLTKSEKLYITKGATYASAFFNITNIATLEKTCDGPRAFQALKQYFSISA